jgi:hypothetical protein
VQGFDITRMDAFITAYTAGTRYALSNAAPAPTTNFVVRQVLTNSILGFLSSTTVTQIDEGSYSDSWWEITGKGSGSIKSGNQSQKFNTEMATFNQFHYVYSTLAPDSNGVVVVEQAVNGNNNWDMFALTSFQSKVVTFAKKLSMSNGDFGELGGLSGKGTLNHQKKNPTYNANINGRGFGRGSSLTAKGLTGPMILSTAELTNVVSITNVAAVPEVSILFTNSDFVSDQTPFGYNDFQTNALGTNVFEANSFYRLIPVPALVSSNFIPDAIMTMDAKGKIMGQKVVLKGELD